MTKIEFSTLKVLLKEIILLGYVSVDFEAFSTQLEIP